MSAPATERLNQPMEYALKNLVEHGRFGPGVTAIIPIALEERGLITVTAHQELRHERLSR